MSGRKKNSKENKEMKVLINEELVNTLRNNIQALQKSNLCPGMSKPDTVKIDDISSILRALIGAVSQVATALNNVESARKDLGEDHQKTIRYQDGEIDETRQ